MTTTAATTMSIKSGDDVDLINASTTEKRGVDPYVCSMSADVDLTLRDNLAASVQDYLVRIVDELHLIGCWTAEYCRHMLVCQERQELESRAEQAAAQALAPAEATSVQATALFKTELELMRQEMQRAQLDQAQHCANSVSCAENSIRVEHEEQLSDLQHRFEDKLRFFTQQAIGIVEKNQIENDARTKSIDLSVRQLQQQLEECQAKLSALEMSTGNSIANLTRSLCAQQNDIASCSRRVENVESSLSLQLNEMGSRFEESLQCLRAAQSQLSSKIQVTRIELHESANECQRKVQQLSKLAQNRSGAHQEMTRMPISKQFWPPPRSSSSQPSAPRSKQDEAAFLACSVGTATSSNGVKIPIGTAGILASPDCFVYAKASLPQRDGVESPFRRPQSATCGSATSSHEPAGLAKSLSSHASPHPDKRSRDLSDLDIDNVLLIQSSVLSRPLGRENDGIQDDEPMPVTQSSILVSTDRVQRPAAHPQTEQKAAYIRPPTTTPTTTSSAQASVTVHIPTAAPVSRKILASGLHGKSTAPSRLSPQRPNSSRP